MKINRRDYLKRLSAAGMLAGVTGLEGFAHENLDPQRSCPAEPACLGQSAPLVWEPRWCDPLPSGPNVKLIFEGLTGIAPVRLGNGMGCEVGFHSKGDSPIHHELEITAYSNVVDPTNCPRPETFDRKIERVSLTVTDPVPEVAQTYFYQRGPACTRRDLTYDEDFRWIIDFESDYLYRKHPQAGSVLEKNKDVYSPVLLVQYGIFYTLHKTASTFLARSEDNKYFIDLANVAQIIAANVYVRSGPVMLTVNNRPPVPIHPPAEIYFKNHCKKGTGHCEFESTHTDKKKRSDFFMNYEAFERKGAPEYYLHLLQAKTPQIPNVICERGRFSKLIEEKKFNDESPCSAAGYGGENRGLPPY
jgi:hypothetical protein